MNGKASPKRLSKISCIPSLPTHNNTTPNSKRKSIYLSMTVPSIQTDVSQLNYSCKRVVFLDLNGFYECWRILASDVLFDAMLILPNVYTEWILRPKTFINIPRKIDAILSDKVFLKMLQWKLESGLVFCMLNTPQTVASWNLAVNNEQKEEQIAPFWRYLSQQLCQLPDPLTFKTANYNPLIFDPALFPSDSELPSVAFLSALQTMTLASKASAVVILRALLQQSNPSLFVVESHDEMAGHGRGHSPLSEDVLDELSMEVFTDGLFDEISVDVNIHQSMQSLTGNDVPITPFTPFENEQEEKFDAKLMDDILSGVLDEWCFESTEDQSAKSRIKMDLASTNDLGGLSQQSVPDSPISPTLVSMDSECDDDDDDDQDEQIEKIVATTLTTKQSDSLLKSNDWWVRDEYYANFETPELSNIQEAENENDEDLY